MKRGQFQHVFTFLMLMIIAVVVLLLGYRFLSKILAGSCEVEQAAFIDDLRQDLRNYASFGSFHAPNIPSPCDMRAICFVDASNFVDGDNDGLYDPPTGAVPNSNDPWDAGNTTNGQIRDEVNTPSNPPHNVFLIDKDGTTRYVDFFAEKVALENPDKPLCVNATSGRFRLGFRGKGRTVLITDETMAS